MDAMGSCYLQLIELIEWSVNHLGLRVTPNALSNFPLKSTGSTHFGNLVGNLAKGGGVFSL
jgi:hypothetical protein